MWGFGIVVWWKGSGVFSRSEDQGCAHRIWRGEFPSNGYLRVNPSIASQGLLKIMRHTSQWDNPDRNRDNPQRAGPENPSNLCGQLMVGLRFLVVALPSLPTSLGA